MIRATISDENTLPPTNEVEISTGCLLSPNWVLTSAHGLWSEDGRFLDKIVVHVTLSKELPDSTEKRFEESEDIDVDSAYILTNYNPKDNKVAPDWALLPLKSSPPIIHKVLERAGSFSRAAKLQSDLAKGWVKGYPKSAHYPGPLGRLADAFEVKISSAANDKDLLTIGTETILSEPNMWSGLSGAPVVTHDQALVAIVKTHGQDRKNVLQGLPTSKIEESDAFLHSWKKLKDISKRPELNKWHHRVVKVSIESDKARYKEVQGFLWDCRTVMIPGPLSIQDAEVTITWQVPIEAEAGESRRLELKTKGSPLWSTPTKEDGFQVGLLELDDNPFIRDYLKRHAKKVMSVAAKPQDDAKAFCLLAYATPHSIFSHKVNLGARLWGRLDQHQIDSEGEVGGLRFKGRIPRQSLPVDQGIEGAQKLDGAPLFIDGQLVAVVRWRPSHPEQLVAHFLHGVTGEELFMARWGSPSIDPRLAALERWLQRGGEAHQLAIRKWLFRDEEGTKTAAQIKEKFCEQALAKTLYTVDTKLIFYLRSQESEEEEVLKSAQELVLNLLAFHSELSQDYGQVSFEFEEVNRIKADRVALSAVKSAQKPYVAADHAVLLVGGLSQRTSAALADVQDVKSRLVAHLALKTHLSEEKAMNALENDMRRYREQKDVWLENEPEIERPLYYILSKDIGFSDEEIQQLREEDIGIYIQSNQSSNEPSPHRPLLHALEKLHLSKDHEKIVSPGSNWEWPKWFLPRRKDDEGKDDEEE